MTSETNSNGPVISLELTDDVQKNQIVTASIYNFNSKSVTCVFNHKYENMTIDSLIEVGKWKESKDDFGNKLRHNGVTEEDIISLLRMLDSNSERITDCFTEQTLTHQTAGQKIKIERIEKLKNGPPTEASVSQALMMREGNVLVKGMFVGGSPKVENMYLKVGFRCEVCDGINILADYSKTRPMLQSEVPDISPKSLRKKKCKHGCQNQSGDDEPESFEHEPYIELVPARAVELHGTDKELQTNDPPNMNVILFNDCTIEIPWNEPIKITGSIEKVNIKGKLLSHIFVGLPRVSGESGSGSEDDVNSPTNSIEYIDEIESVEITPEDEKKFQDFLTEHKGKVLDELAKLYAPSHIGDEDAKKMVLICAANAGIGSHNSRINILFIGETGLDKTPLAKNATRIVPGSKFSSATDSTTNSLICVVDPDTGHFRFGPVVTANGAILVVDEFGRMPKEERATHAEFNARRNYLFRQIWYC